MILTNTNQLDIVKTFECGQCFRWNADKDGQYYGIVGDSPARIHTQGNEIIVESNASKEYWENYFDLQSDYESHSQPFSQFPYLKTCMDYGIGIRILRQNSWEALCSFIISQCNNIKRIKGIIERLCTRYGDEIFFEDKVFYTFPSAWKLAQLNVEDLEFLRAGYRSQYIINAAKAVDSKEIILDELIDAPYERATKELLKINGVGIKVANCTVLFGLHHMEAFPIDVWMKKALNEHFPKDFCSSTLGDYAGLAQQYIFYYTRENGITR